MWVFAFRANSRVRSGAISAVLVISLGLVPAGTAMAGRLLELAQAAPDADHGPGEPSQPAAADAPANSPAQIRKAQIELKRLDCWQGRADGKLNAKTREAVKKFWASTKEPVGEVKITDALIADMAGRGDNYCRPARPFFAIGGRPGSNPALMPFFPGGRPIIPQAAPSEPTPPAPPPPPAAQ